ncbi:MAG: metallo-mystery pair system four-Cys motif protein [Sandaracinus sp.]
MRSSFRRSSVFLTTLTVASACSTTPAPASDHDACDYIASACHGAPGAAAEACHETAHADVLATCEAMLSSCLAVCTSDAAVPADTSPTPDAATAPDAGAPTDGGPGEVVLRFTPRVGSEAFSCTGTYMMGSPATEAQPVDLRLYVHDVRLVTAAGEEVPVTLADNDFQRMGVALLDFEDGTGSCNQGDAETNAEIRGTVPDGEYTGVRFRVGIPFDLNHVDLTTLPSPLNRTSLFWGWAFGHLFFAGVTRTVAVGPGIDAAGEDAGAPVAYEHVTHLGSTMCEGDPAMGIPVTSCARPNRPSISLSGFDAATDSIVVDLGAVKAHVDVAHGASCHSFQPDCAFPFDALGLNWATGSETPTTQTVFRVE